MYIDGDIITYKCLIRTFLINPDFDTTEKKHKVVTSDDIKSRVIISHDSTVAKRFEYRYFSFALIRYLSVTWRSG